MTDTDMAAYLWAACGQMSILVVWESTRLGVRRWRIRRGTRQAIRDVAAIAALVRRNHEESARPDRHAGIQVQGRE